MKKLLFISLLFLAGSMHAQTNLTFYNFNTVGQSSLLNPALVPRQAFTLGIADVYTHLYVPGISVYDIFRADETGQQTLDKVLGSDKYHLKDIQINNEVNLAFVGFRIKRNYFSFGLQNTFNQQIGLPKDLLSMLYFGNAGTGSLFGKDIKFSDIQFKSSAYSSIYLSYTRDFNDKLTIGVRGKYLIGYYDADLIRNNSTLKTDSGSNNSLKLVATSDIEIRGAGYDRINAFTVKDADMTTLGTQMFQKPVGSGLAIDMGANYKFNSKLSVNASVLNLGYINWTDAKMYTNKGTFTFEGFVTDDPSKIGDSATTKELSDSIAKIFETKENPTNGYKTTLDPKIYMGVQYHLLKSSTLGLTGYAEKWNGKFYTGASASFTQRFWRLMDVRVNYNMYRDQKANVGVGLSLQLFPVVVYVMTDNVRGIATSGMDLKLNTNYTNFRFGLNIALGGRFDKDNDGVPNRKDKCKKIPGLYKMHGCPDTDKDGIANPDDECVDLPGPIRTKGCPDKDNDGVRDALDSCVNDSGSMKLQGCPDKDNDGVADKYDKCPNDSGMVSQGGCPDKDGDGILDKLDNCPDKKGPAITKGCPDMDRDSVADKDDQCPNIAGPVALKGCPDSDGDGIIDRQDSCVNAAGPASTFGCPDTDGDGVIDRFDNCPTEAGTLENSGCPVLDPSLVILNEEEKKVLNEAFSNLEFNTGTSKISEASLASLAGLAELLIAKPTYKLEISGHTDNMGNAAKNLKLSQDRAKAVKTYLTGKGVESARLKASGFGSKKPIADNKTPEGRQKNRRVEFKIVK